MVVDADVNDDGDIEEQQTFRFDKIETNVNDKLFENWEKGLANNIRKSIGGIPALLIDYEDGKLSGTSGESIIQASNYYNALTRDIRAQISNAFREIFSNSTNETLANNSNWDITELSLIEAEIQEQKDEAELKRLESQANLKGSVGGVTALLELQQAVSAGTADKEAAIEIVKNIYGFDEATAEKMIGTPKELEDDGTTNDTSTASN